MAAMALMRSLQRGYLNDVWKYDITLNQWAWLSGDKNNQQHQQ